MPYLQAFNFTHKIFFIKEIAGISGRLAVAVLEHRDTRNHWLSEKSELESRNFQMLALQTQVQGTMRKKEKDYEKLQGQLDKVVRDSMRGNKSTIIVSKPLQKNSSQVKTNGTLLDAELIAAKSIMSLLKVKTFPSVAIKNYFAGILDFIGDFLLRLENE